MAYTAPRTDENLANMMTCQKAMSQKLHYVFAFIGEKLCASNTAPTKTMAKLLQGRRSAPRT